MICTNQLWEGAAEVGGEVCQRKGKNDTKQQPRGRSVGSGWDAHGKN